jgi:hypothetical protein
MLSADQQRVPVTVILAGQQRCRWWVEYTRLMSRDLGSEKQAERPEPSALVLPHDSLVWPVIGPQCVLVMLGDPQRANRNRR